MRKHANLAIRRRVWFDRHALPEQIALLRPCQSGTRKLIGESRFSYSGRTREEPSMMHAAARERLGKRGLGHVLAKQSARLTRVRKIFKAIGLGQRFNFGGKWRSRHYLASARRCAVTACQTAVSTLETGRLASISTQRLGSSVAISRKPLRSASWVSIRSAS